MPAPTQACNNALPVKAVGCGCQPLDCNPPPPVPKPTKVLVVQCHDVTNYTRRMVAKAHNKFVMMPETRTRKVNKPVTTYKKTKARRYRIETVLEKTFKEETRKVKKTVMRKVQHPVKVPVTQNNFSPDCCGRTNRIPIDPCSCKPGMSFKTEYITKEMPQVIEVDEIVKVPCEVEVNKRVPYEVEVNTPVVTFELVDEEYTV